MTRSRQFLSSRKVSALVTYGLLAAAPQLLAGEIYRCEGDGPKALVDLPARCPNGRAIRVGGAGSAARAADVASAVKARTERVEKIEKVTSSREGSRDHPISGVGTELRPAEAHATQTAEPTPAPASVAAPTPASPSAAAVAGCARLRPDAAALRKCLQEERRREVRAIALSRLAKLSAAAAELARSTQTGNGLLAVGRNGRPVAWCEGFLGDLLAMRNLEVVDDEMVPGPRWINASGSVGVSDLRSGEIIDTQFTELIAPGGPVVNGYVTLRWRNQRTVLVRSRPTCVEVSPGTARCAQQRYMGIDVHDDEMAQACNISFYGRAYWPQWQDKNVEIRTPMR